MTVTMTLEEYEELKTKADKYERAEENTNFWIKLHDDANNERLRWEERFCTLEGVLIDKFGLTHHEVWDYVEHIKKWSEDEI